MRRETVRLRLRESWPRVVLSLATPPLLVLLAWGAWALQAHPIVVAVLAVLAAALGYVAAVDFPLAVEVEKEGIRRICVLRRHLIPWAEIDSITRSRRTGLLVVTTDGRRHVLVDRSLDESELSLLRAQAGQREVEVSF